MQNLRWLLLTQGAYYTTTGIWPWVSLKTFEMVTGPKVDDWLVLTVGALAAAIGATLLMAGRRANPSADSIWLSALSALAFAGVDVYFVLNGQISRVYLVDAALQIVFLAFLTARGPWLEMSRN
jgi:hypothetical protein